MLTPKSASIRNLFMTWVSNMTPHVIISVVQDMLVDFVEREIIANALIKNILRLTYNTMQQRHTQKYNKNFTSPHYPTKKRHRSNYLQWLLAPSFQTQKPEQNKSRIITCIQISYTQSFVISFRRLRNVIQVLGGFPTGI